MYRSPLAAAAGPGGDRGAEEEEEEAAAAAGRRGSSLWGSVRGRLAWVRAARAGSEGKGYAEYVLARDWGMEGAVKWTGLKGIGRAFEKVALHARALSLSVLVLSHHCAGLPSPRNKREGGRGRGREEGRGR